VIELKRLSITLRFVDATAGYPLIPNEIHPRPAPRPKPRHRQKSSKVVRKSSKPQKKHSFTKAWHFAPRRRAAPANTPRPLRPSDFNPASHDVRERFRSMYPLAGAKSRSIFLFGHSFGPISPCSAEIVLGTCLLGRTKRRR
jgi:hypothetical protein